MKIGIVSDTHDNLDKTRKAVNHFLEENVEVVIHCGDLVSPFTAKLFDQDFGFYAVKGNNDGEWKLKETVESFGKWMNQLGEIELEGYRFAVYHGTEKGVVKSLIGCGEYDYVLRGHTHTKTINEYNGTIEINPGGIKIPGTNESFHVATLDTSTGDVSFHKV